jgi:hypothetical protein
MLSFLGRGKGGEAPEPSSQPMDTSEVSLADAERVTLRCEAVLEGHGADEVGVARVWHCAWDPAGKTLATCSSDKTCRIWAKSAAAAGRCGRRRGLLAVRPHTGATMTAATNSNLSHLPIAQRRVFFPINLALGAGQTVESRAYPMRAAQHNCQRN